MPADIWAKWLDESDREGATADRQVRILRSQVRDRILHKAGIKRGSRIVDLGCGMGFISLEAARMAGPDGQVTAVDSSTGALEALTRRGRELGLTNLRPLEADISAMPLEDGIADVVVARSVLCYQRDRLRVLTEALRILRPGGVISLFEPVLSEEELSVDWGEEIYAWTKLKGVLDLHHPAYSFGRGTMIEEMREAGFTDVDYFVWHAEVTRPYGSEDEALEDFRTGMPGELSLVSCWLEHGVTMEEIGGVAKRLADESAKPSFRDTLPCVYLWGTRP